MNLYTAHLTMPYALEIIAITVGALSGALHATRKQMGVLGIIAVAFATGLGGGAIRDVILDDGTPTFLTNGNILAYAVLGAVIAYFFARVAVRFEQAFVLLDAMMLGAWVLMATSKAVQLNLGVVASVYVGLIAATGGGLLRDLLCKDPPAVLQPGQWQAIAVLCAAVTFVGSVALDVPFVIAQIATMTVATTLLLSSRAFTFQLPTSYDVSDRIIRIFRPAREL